MENVIIYTYLILILCKVTHLLHINQINHKKCVVHHDEYPFIATISLKYVRKGHVKLTCPLSLH